MSSLKHTLIVLAALGGLAAVGSLMNSRQVAAQGRPGSMAVNIVNPLPVPVSGSTTVSGTVAATQSGAWNVGIAGTPTVNANVAFPSSLAVNNATDAHGNPLPLLTQDPTYSATHSFNFFGFCNLSGAAPACNGDQAEAFSVAAGNVAVVESVSGFCDLPTGDSIGFIQLTGHSASNFNALNGGLTILPGPVTGYYLQSFAQNLKGYFAGGPSGIDVKMSLAVVGSAALSQQCVWQINGYMVQP
jgi:hypothetical protein